MLYYLHTFSTEFHVLNLFKYITFRAALAIAIALLMSFVLGAKFIKFLQNIQGEGQPIRKNGPESHQVKKGTPTMGGLMILSATTFTLFLCADLSNPYIWISLFVMLSYGMLGFWDDYTKIRKRNHEGISGKAKLFWQILVGLVAVFFLSKIQDQKVATHLALPFMKDFSINLGLFYIVFGSIVITGASNAVNLTDGLDGLAIGPVIIVCACFAIISYIVGNAIFAQYLHIQGVHGAGELTVLCAAVIGAGLGFLWYNAPPAQIFMGDVGSLALGGVIGVISVITKHEIVLFITGGLFVIEAISVMLQIGSYKIRKKRIFKMAPIHHHFEKLGWTETKIVIRFWIISIVFALIGLSTLKLR